MAGSNREGWTPVIMAVLRGAAIVIAVGGVIDPACDVRSHERPELSVEIVGTPSLALPAEGGGTRRDLAQRMRQTLRDNLGAQWQVVDGPVSTAAARVVVGDAAPAIELGPWSDSRMGRTPVHAVTIASPLRPNVRIVNATAPRQITIWDGAAIHASIEGRGLKGQKVTVRLFKDDVALASMEHVWTSDAEVFGARLMFLPPAVDTHRLEIRASSSLAERAEVDNRVSLLVDANDVRRRVLVYQPRLSWMGTFVARAIESDPRFELASRAQASRGISVSAGKALDAFDAFDAVVVGAPDALVDAEVEALDRYVTDRGGSVLLVADRKPGGPYVRLAPSPSFDELLLQKPTDIAQGLRASELIVPRRPREGWEPLSSDRTRPVLMSVLRGQGRVVFSGALDAWRYREGSRYWQDLVAGLAARTPPAVHVHVEPAVVRPGEPIEVSSNVPVARIDDRALKLWPGGEPGIFRTQVRSPAQTGIIKVSAEKDGAVAHAVVSIDPGAASAWSDNDATLGAFAAAHGGRIVTAQDIGRLVNELRQTAERRPTSRTVRPMRSAWWIAPFAAFLGAEWTLRRRRHLH
jgi:hypothetical protein